MTLGEKIRQARQGASLKTKQLAAEIGVTDRAVRFWEADKRAPGFELVVAIARATDQPLDYFADGSPPLPEEEK